MGKHRHHNHHSRIHKKDAYKAMFGVVFLITLMAAAYGLLNRWEEGAFPVDGSASEGSLQKVPGLKTLTIDGKTYRQRKHLDTYLFLGIDVEGPAKAIEGYYGGGQADVQMLIVLDHDKETWQVLQLNRDTMAEVPIIGIQGNVVGTKYEQIALSHSYGNGMEESCRNSVKTVSDLLWGQEIDGYLSMNMDGVAIINDAVGGVPVTITTDFSQVDETLRVGETITLEGSQALTFIRSRWGVDDQTNIARMARQRKYLDALSKKLGSLDAESVLRVYDSVYEYLVTDMGSQTIVDLVDTMEKYEQLELLTIDGEAVVEKGHWAFYPDKESLQETILQMFYNIEE